MKFYIENMIEALQQKRNDCNQQSDTYQVLGEVIDMLKYDLKLEDKLVREV